jgi:hypothetical protein
MYCFLRFIKFSHLYMLRVYQQPIIRGRMNVYIYIYMCVCVCVCVFVTNGSCYACKLTVSGPGPLMVGSEVYSEV